MTSENLDTPSGWAKRREAIAMQIEIATLKLCLDRGIDAPTVEDIAIAVGLSRRTIYRYFDSIEDILRASPIRRLKQIVHNVEARPLSESIRDAFVNAMKDKDVPEEGIIIQQMGSQLAKKYPAEWRRVIAPVASATDTLYENVTAHRLSARGQDPKWARLLSGTIVFVIQRINRDLGNTSTSSHEQLDEALDILATELAIRAEPAG